MEEREAGRVWNKIISTCRSDVLMYMQAPCCTHPNIQWFNNTLIETSTEDIELRLCVDQPVIQEGSSLQVFELFVK